MGSGQQSSHATHSIRSHWSHLLQGQTCESQDISHQTSLQSGYQVLNIATKLVKAILSHVEGLQNILQVAFKHLAVLVVIPGHIERLRRVVCCDNRARTGTLPQSRRSKLANYSMSREDRFLPFLLSLILFLSLSLSLILSLSLSLSDHVGFR